MNKKVVSGGDDLDMPDFLKRKPGETPSTKPATTPKATATTDKKKSKYSSLEKPESMSDEEYEKFKNAKLAPGTAPKAVKKAKNDIADGEAAEARAAKAPKKKVSKEDMGNNFTISDWAREVGIDPKDARRAARTIKSKLAALQTLRKYVWDKKDKAEVAKLIQDARTEQMTKAATKKTPPPAKKKVAKNKK